jgi:Dyp-type peroxidase family
MAKSQLKDRAAILLDLEQIQGDVLIGLQKNYERFVFFQIANVNAFKTTLRIKFASHVTSSAEVLHREHRLERHKAEGGREVLPLVGVNVAFTDKGIKALAPAAKLDPTNTFDKVAKDRATVAGDVRTGDVPTNWKAPFANDTIDGVFLVTGGTTAAVDDETSEILNMFGAAITVLFDQTGNVRPGAENGHEHFGWKDGISQPGVNGLNNPFPGQQLLDPGTFVFGYGANQVPPLPWMINGSFMVFRRLNQLVPEFGAYLETEADQKITDPVLLGARLVGRWKSGAPLELTPSMDNPAVGADPNQNNNFDYSDDQGQFRCPFGAHIRKTNPRTDISEAGLDPHRIIRAGIPFGPEVSAAEQAAGVTQQERGLMFVCYQTSIASGFEFLQHAWANNPRFVSPLVAKHRPGPGGAPITEIGFDPIIGQNDGSELALLVNPPQPRKRRMDEPKSNYPNGTERSTLDEPNEFIVPTGDAYFFVPSISAILNELS